MVEATTSEMNSPPASLLKKCGTPNVKKSSSKHLAMDLVFFARHRENKEELGRPSAATNKYLFPTVEIMLHVGYVHHYHFPR